MKLLSHAEYFLRRRSVKAVREHSLLLQFAELHTAAPIILSHFDISLRNLSYLIVCKYFVYLFE